MVMDKKMELEPWGVFSNGRLVVQGQRLQAGLHFTPHWIGGRSTWLCATITVHCL